jgi:hypothetical protein
MRHSGGGARPLPFVFLLTAGALLAQDRAVPFWPDAYFELLARAGAVHFQ